MAFINNVILAGNLPRDPELTYTPKGTASCKAALAVNRSWKNEAGEKQEEVSFIDITAWGKTGETIAQWFKKGGNLMVEGRLKQDTWEDKTTGDKRSKVHVIVDRFHFMGKNEGKAADGSSPAPRSKVDRSDLPPGTKAADATPSDDDQVPF